MSVVKDLIGLYIMILLVSVVISWISPTAPSGLLGRIDYYCRLVTEPVLRPVRKALPMVRVGGAGIDFSAFIVILVLGIIERSI